MLFLIQGTQVAASRYRVLQYLPYLNVQGVKTDFSKYPETVFELYRFFTTLDRYDCVFLQRKRFHGPLLWLLRNRARRLIYDFDDAVMYRNSTALTPYSRTRQKQFAAMISACDSVIAGNTFLKTQAQRYCNNVTMIPSVIDQDRYSQKEYGLRKQKVTIGWIGDHGSIHYLEKMKPVFEELGRKYPQVELEIICDVFFDCDYMPIIKRMWDSEHEIEYLKELDIGVMPLTQDPWSEGKCGLKIIQYFGVGVPTVCTPVGINKDVVRDGFSGYFAETPEQWVEKLSILIESRELREMMGMRGRETVLRSFSLEACAPKYYEVIRNTVSEGVYEGSAN